MSTGDSATAAPHPGGSDAAHRRDGAEQLVRMANDIGRFFGAEPEHEEAVAGVANHLSRFWTKRMRDKLRTHLEGPGKDDLDDLPREALARLTG